MQIVDIENFTNFNLLLFVSLFWWLGHLRYVYFFVLFIESGGVNFRRERGDWVFLIFRKELLVGLRDLVD